MMIKDIYIKANSNLLCEVRSHGFQDMVLVSVIDNNKCVFYHYMKKDTFLKEVRAGEYIEPSKLIKALL